MQTTLEIIGAFILTLMLISLVFKMQINAYESNIEATMTYRQQSYAEVLKEVLRNNIKNVGKSFSSIDQAIQTATGSKLEFLADMDTDGVIDTVSIYSTKWITKDPTPDLDDMQIVFKVNKTMINTGFYGVTEFKFKYYDNHYEETANLEDIQFISYQFEMESSEAFGANAEKTGERAVAIGEGVVFLKCIWDW